MIKIYKYGEISENEIFARCEAKMNVEEIVADIIKNVAENGDKAVKEYCLKFDKANLDTLLVSEEEIEEAVNSVEPEFLRILSDAAGNIRTFFAKTTILNRNNAASFIKRTDAGYLMRCKNKVKPRGVLSNFWASFLLYIMYNVFVLMIISSELSSLCRWRCG